MFLVSQSPETATSCSLTFDAISTLFVAPFAGGPLGTFYDGGDSPREFNSTIFEMINASHYLQLLIIKIKWISEVFEGMTPDEQEDFFFRGRSDRERRAFQTIFSFVKKGGGVGPTAFIARQIATVYKLTFESPVSYSRLKHLDTLEERGNKLTSTERQFHDGNSLRFACVLIRELRLDDFMERDLLTDRDAPFPWLETAKGIQNNPWEQVKNKIGTIWENDKKRPNKSQIFSWMTPETSK